MTFEGELQFELDEAKGDLTRQLVKIGLKGLTGVVIKTPVDTGTAQNSWGVEIGDEPSDEAQTSGSPTTIEAAKIRQADLGDVIHIFNNVRYIRPLENGHSQQAPQGMVSVTLAELQSRFGGF